jgi:hypothetical protein
MVCVVVISGKGDWGNNCREMLKHRLGVVMQSLMVSDSV